jgi:hypothetical protein
MWCEEQYPLDAEMARALRTMASAYTRLKKDGHVPAINDVAGLQAVVELMVTQMTSVAHQH